LAFYAYHVVSGLLTDPNQMNSIALIAGAQFARSGGDLEEAGFLHLAAQTRYRIDAQVFPPVKSGDASPGVLLAALASSLGQPLMVELENDPVAFARAVKRFEKWSPEFPTWYRPGWEYRTRSSDAQAAAVVTAAMQPVLAAARSRAKLLQNAEYVRLSQIVKEAGVVEQRYFSAGGGLKGPADLKQEYGEAWERKNEALLGMRVIESDLCPETRWHAVTNWKAEAYFDDPQVVALCRAIEANDIAEMERLIAAGANVNATGKGNMTPLLWAFPERRLERFSCLLEHGADPNVRVTSSFELQGRPLHPHPRSPLVGVGMDNGCRPGQSVTSLAARSPDREYLRLVLEHGGDPNFTESETGMTPLHIAMDSYYRNDRERATMLIDQGADLNVFAPRRQGAPMMIALRNMRYSTVLQLLKAGADPYPVRYLLDEPPPKLSLPESAAEYQALVAWLKERTDAAK
jgi:uncharacterized protein